MTEKIQKVLARSGIASRRQIEKMLVEGRIIVNGSVAKLGDRISEKDHVSLDSKKLKLDSNITPRVIIYNKPTGEIVSRDDPENRTSAFDNLPKLKDARWINVGRLDINTSGLLLFTTDGELANKLMHPSSGYEREYAVRILGVVEEDIMQRLKRGVKLEDGIARFSRIRRSKGGGANQWFYVTVTEGRNKIVRRLLESQGLTVSRLIRIRYGKVRLPRMLKQGQFHEINIKDI